MTSESPDARRFDVPCVHQDCRKGPPVPALTESGELRPRCPDPRPRVPHELLPGWLFEEHLVLPDASVPAVKTALQRSVLEHVQRCLILLHPLTGRPPILDHERTDEERMATEAYSTLHNLEKEWLRRLGKPEYS